MPKVLFVCIGNSCRSPMAEAILRKMTTGNPNDDDAAPPSVGSHCRWLIDSAGLADWNVGRPPEPRAIQVLAVHGLHSDHIARQITTEDFYHYDIIFGMDDSNMDDLRAMAPPDATACLELLGRYDYGRPEAIADPYFGRGIAGFETAFEQIQRSCQNFVAATPDYRQPISEADQKRNYP